MATHPADKHSTNPRVQCSVCGQWKRIHCQPYQSAGGYTATQKFFGGCKYGNGDHLVGDHVDVCDDCCHEHCARAPKLCDGCNVQGPWEHRCLHGSANVSCACELCRESRQRFA